MTVQSVAFDKMEKELLPVFAEAVKLCKDVSDNPNYFREPDNYCAARRLYAMALVSKAVKLVNKDVITEEHQKENINQLDLSNARHFYQPNGEVGQSENIFNKPEIVDFREKMRSLGASYYDDTIIKECLGCLKYDVAVGMWQDNPSLVSPHGNILDWKEAKNLNIFKFAITEMKSKRFLNIINSQAKENHWDKKELDKNYPVVNRECEKYFEIKFAQYCKDRQNKQVININCKQQTL